MSNTNLVHFFIMLLPVLAMLVTGYCMERVAGKDTPLYQKRHWERISGTICLLAGLFVLQWQSLIPPTVLPDSLQWREGVGFWSVITVLLSAVSGWYIVHKSKPMSAVWQLRQSPHGSKLPLLIVWILYLLIYECYFRKLLLPVQSFSPILLWTLNLLAYSLAHVPHGRAETIASIPYGLLLGLSAVQTGSIWPAVLGHVSLVLFTQFLSYHIPESKKLIPPGAEH